MTLITDDLSQSHIAARDAGIGHFYMGVLTVKFNCFYTIQKRESRLYGDNKLPLTL